MKHIKNLSLLVALFGMIFGALGAHAGKDGWMHDYDEALAKAKAEGKHVLVEFHGSDWCPPCIKLNKEVLTKDAFKKLAKEKLVLVDADFPRKTKLPAEQTAHNEALAGKFGVQYFPTVLIIDGDGNVLDKSVGFPEGGLEGFLKFISDKTDS
ncbi:MAG: thioredoxin family protein [Puniceicoccaceae bacterium]